MLPMFLVEFRYQYYFLINIIFYQQENSQECSNIVNCFVDPCQVTAECPGHPDAKCVASYCGGCYARFVDSSGNVIEECSHQPNQRCEGGQKWNRCGSPCTKSCGDPEPVCQESCEAKCECPPTKPIWRDGKCIAEEMCLEPPPPPVQGIWSPVFFTVLSNFNRLMGREILL